MPAYVRGAFSIKSKQIATVSEVNATVTITVTNFNRDGANQVAVIKVCYFANRHGALPTQYAWTMIACSTSMR